MVAYAIEQKVAKLLTIHPLKGGQKQKSVSGIEKDTKSGIDGSFL
jgi:hypothetical protein